MLVFIGTLHCNLTPHKELIEIIEAYEPAQLLVEIAGSDIERNEVGKYPDEMQATLAWAVAKQVPVHGFDALINGQKPGVTAADLARLDEEQSAIISKHDWKDFNKTELAGILETETWHKIVDTAKDTERNEAMAQNIIHLTDDSHATTVIITGSGHIPFFKTAFPEAEFPLAR
jgi:hypothetical protein